MASKMQLGSKTLLVTVLTLCFLGSRAALSGPAGANGEGRQPSPPLGAEKAEETPRLMNKIDCAPPNVPCKDPGESVLARTSTPTSRVRVLTARYADNLHRIMDWLPERWDLVAVLKWSAYGNDIHILGPIAARMAPALAVLTNEDAAALAPYKPKAILRIGPATYKIASEAVAQNLQVQEFIGTRQDLEMVTRVAREHNTTIDVSLFLFDHYGDPWGFEVDAPEELQRIVDSIDPRYVRVRGIFSHLGYLPKGPVAKVTERVQRFLRVACPVAVKIASSLNPNDPPILVHWGATSELGRLWDERSEKLQLPPDLVDLARVCMSQAKVRFGIRVGSATYGTDTHLPHLQPVLWWTAPIAKLQRLASTNVAVVKIGIEDGYPRVFKQQGKWGEVSIGGKRYPLAAAPRRHMILVDVGQSYDAKSIFVGAEVCLLCDDPTSDDLYANWVAAETHNIAICATGVGAHFADDPSIPCKGPIVIDPDEEH